MSCQVEQVADCGDLSSIARALFITEREDPHWLTQCSVSLSSCGNLLGIAFRNRLCLLTSHWISSTDSHTYIITWSGTLPSDITAILALPLCPTQHSSQNGPDWFCVIVGFQNGCVGFYTNTGHLLFKEKLDEKPVMKISCHTGTYGTLPDDIYVFFQSCFCIITGNSLFQVLRNAKAELAKVQAGFQDNYNISSNSINIRKWTFSDQETINDAAVVGIELKNSYDHLLAASSYGGYDTWYRSVPPVNTLLLGAGVDPYVGFHYALEGGTAPPLQDVARAVASKIKSVLPGWLGGGSGENQAPNEEPVLRAENLLMRAGIYDAQRQGASIVLSPDRRLAAISDSVGRVAVLDVQRGHLIRIFKGYREAQCAFIQVFDGDNKKPQLSVVKDIERAIFLIIYNPKKGLIDIRIMQNGKRVAVFTATKNGLLLYNTCGLVGAEKNYTYKKLNLPEFQCVLLDSDGKLKKFNIPFCYAMEGANSERYVDLQTLRELRDYIRKSSNESEDFCSEICKKISTLKTSELKKHCLDLLIKKYEGTPKIIASCLEIFWDSTCKVELNENEEKIKTFFINLTFVTLFYRRINNEITNDMDQLILKITEDEPLDDQESVNDVNELKFQLLEDDNCILERLLHLTSESGYKDTQNKVTFADSYTSSYKDFISCFVLDEKTDYIYLKTQLSNERLDKLACDIFKLIFNIQCINNLTNCIQMSKIESKEIIKLIIRHIMNMPLEEVDIPLIERFIAVFYYICRASKDASNIPYNEVSPWWQNIRDILTEMPCPLRSMIVAMACKAVSRMFEAKTNGRDDEAWVALTKENTKWGILIGKLEDISILSIVLMFKEVYNGKSLPTIKCDDISINLKYVYTRGKGSVTELIAKWLCSMGVPAEAIIVNELMDLYNTHSEGSVSDEESSQYMFMQNHRDNVDNNTKIFKWLSLLRRQFPLSTAANYLIANMCWEYALSWQKKSQFIEYLNAVVHCLNNISDPHIQLGLLSIIWSTYIKNIFEATCRLVNKVGRLPKDALCLQDIGFGNVVMVNFLETCTKYLDNFRTCSYSTFSQEKQTIQYENIWNDSMPSLVEIAQNTKSVNNDILDINYQISCTIYYQCFFNLKYSKPLDVLYDVDYQYVFDALTGEVLRREINTKTSEKVKNPRLKFLTKLIRASIDTITCTETESSMKQYNTEECSLWIQKLSNLAQLWNVENDFINRQQVIALYHMGYDTLAEQVLSLVRDSLVLLSPLVAITIQRLKRNQARSVNQAEWIVTVPPHLYKKLQNTPLDTSIPAQPSLTTTMLVMQKLLYQIDKEASDSMQSHPDIKLVELMIETCDVLLKRNL